MTIDDFVKIVDSFSKLAGTLAWPALIAFVLMKYATPLKLFFESLGEFTLKGAGFEASAKRKQAEAAAALAAANATRPPHRLMKRIHYRVHETLPAWSTK